MLSCFVFVVHVLTLFFLFVLFVANEFGLVWICLELQQLCSCQQRSLEMATQKRSFGRGFVVSDFAGRDREGQGRSLLFVSHLSFCRILLSCFVPVWFILRRVRIVQGKEHALFCSFAFLLKGVWLPNLMFKICGILIKDLPW